MRILALETSSQSCSVALWLDGKLHFEHEQGARRQTELVLPMVQSLLQRHGVALNQLDGLAFGIGPGAFTGVRVATAVAQGLAFAADLPVVGVSTLAACAYQTRTQLDHDAVVLSVFDARMGEIYLGAYECGVEHVTCLLADQLCRPQQLPDLAATSCVVAGSGLVYQQALLDKYNVSQCLPEIEPTATAVATLAIPEFVAGHAVSAENAMPVYLRNQVVQGAVR